MTNNNNVEKITPITRLRRILDRISNTNPDIDVIRGWKEVFSLAPETQIIDVFPHIIQFQELLNECETLIEDKANPRTKEKYKQQFRRLKGIVNYSSLSTPIKPLQGYIDPILMENLEFCDIEMAEISSENEIEPDEIKNLIDDIIQLKKKIIDSAIDQSIKQITLELLKSLESALIDYQILGIESLEKTIDMEVIKLRIVFDHLGKELKGEDKSIKKIFRKIGSFIEKADKTYRYYTTTVALSSKGIELVETIKKLMPPM